MQITRPLDKNIIISKTVFINRKKLWTTIILSFAFISKINTQYVPWYFPYLCTIPIFGLILNTDIDKTRLEGGLYVFKLAVAPYFFSIAYSFITFGFFYSVINPVSRAFSTTARFSYIVILAVVLFLLFGENVVEIAGDALVLSYVYTLIIAIQKVGISGFAEYFSIVLHNENAINNYFEIHDIGLSVGLLIVYNLFFKEDKNNFKLCLYVIVLLFCFKRIAILSLLVTIVIGKVLYTKNSVFKDVQVSIILSCIVFCSFLYIWLVTTGNLYVLASFWGVNVSNRKYLYSFMKRFYSWSPFFVGNGFEFTNKYMSSISDSNLSKHIRNMLAVHSDILKTYIDLGFLGSILWFYWGTWGVSGRLKKRFGNYSKYVYSLVLVYAYIIYTTDNAMSYFAFQLILYLIVLLGCMGALPERLKAKKNI